MKYILTLLLLCGPSYTQTVGLYVYMTSSPPPSGGAQMSALQTDVLNKGYAAGFTIPTGVNAISWKTIDACGGTNCAHGSYTWTSFDALVTSIIGTCSTCKIGIIVQPASDTSPNNVTPAYVFSSTWASGYTCGSSACNPVDQVSCTGTGILATSYTPYSLQPALWEPPGLGAYQIWAAEIVKHFTPGYDSHSASYAANVSYVRFGLFAGGEATVPCPYEDTTTLGNYNLTVPIASAYATALYSSITAMNPPFKVQGPMYGGDPAIYPAYCGLNAGASACITQAYPDAEAAAEVGSGAGIGAESLGMNDVNWYAEGQICQGDACGLFNTYAWTAPIFDWQTYKYSDPTCSPWQSTAACPTGSLVNLLPFATIRMHVGENPNRLNALEIFWQDWMCAYTSSPPTTCPSAPDPDYQTALSNATLGQPNATSTVTGNVAVSGAATIY